MFKRIDWELTIINAIIVATVLALIALVIAAFVGGVKPLECPKGQTVKTGLHWVPVTRTVGKTITVTPQLLPYEYCG